jgi:hypothetical protein
MLDTSDAMLTLAMLAAFALILGGLWLLRAAGGSRVKAGLMIGAGLVTIFNVWINTLPPPPLQPPPPSQPPPPQQPPPQQPVP